MAKPTCLRCGEHTFEMAEVAPLDSQLKVTFMQCATCGAVVGVMDIMNLGSMLLEQGRFIRKIAQKLGVDLEDEASGGSRQ